MNDQFIDHPFQNLNSNDNEDSRLDLFSQLLHHQDGRLLLEQHSQILDAGIISKDACHSEFISVQVEPDSIHHDQDEASSIVNEDFDLREGHIGLESTEILNQHQNLQEDIFIQSDQASNGSVQENEENLNENQDLQLRRLRPKDENNAHKKYQTCLNKLIPTKTKQQIRRRNIQKKLKDEKSQRYGFIIRLIDLKEETSMEFVISLQNKFNTFVRLKFSQTQSNQVETEDICYLRDLVPVYKDVYQNFVNNNIQEAVQALYRCKNYKHKEYEKRGLAKVQERLNCYRRN